MKKVLLVFGSLDRAGAQLRAVDVCRELRQQYPVQFDFCNLSRRSAEIVKDIEEIGSTIHHIPIRSSGFLREFSGFLREQQYDVVDTRLEVFSGVIIPLARMNNVPVRIANWRNSLGNYGGLISNPMFVWLMRTLIKRNATHIVAVSRAALDSAFPPRWQDSCDCRIIYNGLALSSFQFPSERCEVREEFGWPLDSRIVINVARFSRQKNHRTILEATRLAYEVRRNIRLLLVGSGALDTEITRLIDDFDLKTICVTAGVRTDVPRLLLASDAFLFPSLWEGLPGALLEAWAAGLPAVTSSIAPIQEMAKHFPSSILMAAPNDVEKHAEHILTALDMKTDRALAREHFARTPFTLENSVMAYSMLYGLPSANHRKKTISLRIWLR